MWLVDGERIEVLARNIGEFCDVVRELLEKGVVKPYYRFYWVSNSGFVEVPLEITLTHRGWIVELEDT